MDEDELQSLRQLIQDVLAPDVRELKLRVTSFEQRMEARFDSLQQEINTRLDAQESKFDTQFQVVIAEIKESKASAENTALREIGDLRERIAVLEAQRR